jgi:hypothetical protein
MEDNKNNEDLNAGKDSKPEDKKKTDSKADKPEDKETPVTYTEDELAKKIKSAEDELHKKYAKQIEDLEAQIKKLSPVEKSEAEIALEKRIAALEKSEKDIADRERKIAVQEKLSANGLDKGLADYLKDDADIDALSSLVDGIIKGRMKENGYKPVDHSSDDAVTPEEFAKWPYSKKAAFAERHPESFKRLRGKK